MERGENITFAYSEIQYVETTSSVDVYPTRQSVLIPHSEQRVSSSVYSFHSPKSSSLEDRMPRRTMTKSASLELSTSYSIDRESSSNNYPTFTQRVTLSSLQSSSMVAPSVSSTPKVGDDNMADTSAVMSSTASMTIRLTTNSPHSTSSLAVYVTSSLLSGLPLTTGGSTQIGSTTIIASPTRPIGTVTSVSSGSQTEMPVTSNPLSPSTNKAPPIVSTTTITTTTTTEAPPTGSPTSAPFNYKLILYVVPPLLLVVLIVMLIAIGLCVKRYRR